MTFLTRQHRGCPCCGAYEQDQCCCDPRRKQWLTRQLCRWHGCATCETPRDICGCWTCEHEDTAHEVTDEVSVLNGEACPVCGTRFLTWQEGRGLPAKLVQQTRVHPDGCWVFVGPIILRQPRVFVHGEQVSARRLMWTALRGPLRKSIRLYPCRLDRRCILPAHQHRREMVLTKESSNAA